MKTILNIIVALLVSPTSSLPIPLPYTTPSGNCLVYPGYVVPGPCGDITQLTGPITAQDGSK